MIFIDYEKPNFILTFPYNKEDLQIVRDLPVRTWIKEKKYWAVPELAVNTLDSIQASWTPKAQQEAKVLKAFLLSLIDYKFKVGEPRGILRPYQNVGTQFLAQAGNALLGDDMGLGKSIQAIQACIDKKCQTVLILCPATLKLNWANELKKHCNIEALVITGNAMERKKLWKSNYQFKIANYELLLHDWQVIPNSFDAIIADEIVYLKSHSAQRTKLAKKMKSNILKIGLSGIYLEKDLMEFHSIMEFLYPNLLPNYNRFKYRYICWGFNGKPIAYQNLEELHLLTSPFILRRTKAEVLKELPPKIYTDIPLELEPNAREAYDNIRHEFIKWLEEQTDLKWQKSVLEKLIRLRQFVEFPEILGFQFSSIKLEWLEELYNSTNKVVVFTPFASTAKILASHFNTKHYLMGETPNQNRVPMIEKFNTEDKAILISTDAGKFGLNITGADTIVHFGYLYNPAAMFQREDRLHRIGQKSIVNVLKPYIIDSIDEGIRNILHRREGDIAEFMEGSVEMARYQLSKEDYKKLV